MMKSNPPSDGQKPQTPATPPPQPNTPPPPAPGTADPNRPDEPWMREGKKHSGKTEFMASFVAFLEPYWKKLFGLNFLGLAGSPRAWCGLFVGVMLAIAGMKTQKGGAAAKAWAGYGQAIEWRVQGIPKGAIIHLNHKGVCTSGSSNHVGFADADCTAEDLKKSGAVVPVFGGNQNNSVNRSYYPVWEVCAVRYPDGVPLPGRIVKSVGCDKKAATGGSTR